MRLTSLTKGVASTEIRKFYGKEPPGSGSEGEDNAVSNDDGCLYVPPRGIAAPLNDPSSSHTESNDDVLVPMTAPR